MSTLSQKQFEEQYGQETYKQFYSQPQKTSILKDVGIGAAKGLGETAKFMVGIGKGVQSVLPEELSTIKSLPEGETFLDTVDLEAKNKAQLAGKGIELVAEALFPAGIFSKGAKATGASLKGIGSRVGSLSDDIVEGGTKLKENFIDAVSNLDDRTKTALSRTPRDKFEEVLKQGQDALIDDRNRTPLEAVGDSVISGLEQIKSQADSIGQAKSELLKSANVGYQKVGNVAQKAALDIQKAFSDVKLDTSDMNIINKFKDELTFLGKNPSLREVDATIDLLQDQLYKSTRSNVLEVTDRVTGKLRQVLGELNGQIKEKGGTQYQKLNEEYSQLATLMGELNARLGKEGASAGSFVKRLFSPSDARTKQLFEELQQYTNQDYFRDARLAKFVMEVLGDTRSKSLLEEVPMTKTGLVDKAISKVIETVQDPIESARRFIKKTGEQSAKENSAYGAVAGIEVDENGDVQFNPAGAALGFAGLGLAGSMKKSNKINVGSVAKKLDVNDRNVIADFLDNPNDIETYLKVEPMLKAVGVPEGAKLADIEEFLIQVMKKTNL